MRQEASARDSAAPNLKLRGTQWAGNLPRFAKSSRLAKTRTSYLDVAAQQWPPIGRSVGNTQCLVRCVQCLVRCVDAAHLEAGSLEISPISNRRGNHVAWGPIMAGYY